MSSSPTYERVRRRIFTLPTILLLLLMLAGAIAAAIRFSRGLGATTDLSDQTPWGLWIAFDVLCGVALAAGGFTTAAVAHIFGGRRTRTLVRPAVLTALLGYVFVSIGLLIDLGLPWHIWHPVIYWPRHSALFEVAWCVMLYASVLFLELAPPVFERFDLSRIQAAFDRLVPGYSVLALTFFTYLMSRSLAWTAAAAVILTLLALLIPRAFRSRPGTPIILIIAGIVLSTAHQSSLGSLFLLVPDKLSPLWYSPLLPLHFLLSAIAAGFAMVIFEAILASSSFNRPLELEALSGLARFCAGTLWIYMAFRALDITIHSTLSATSPYMTLFAAEIIVGVILPALVLSIPSLRKNPTTLFTSATLVVIGVVLNRFNVTLGALEPTVVGTASTTYFPSLHEILVTLGIVSALVFLYSLAVKLLPVFEKPAGVQEKP